MAKENKTDILLKHLPIRKVADDKQEATGIFTGDVLDSDNEIADYAFQSKQIQDWADEMFQKTTAAGQEASLGNVRLQHTSTPVGKVISYDRDPTAKTIGGTTYIQDANTWDMIKKGILTGFSFGGHYLWRKCDECKGDMPLQCGDNFCPACQKDVPVRYGAKIAELSVCDRPAVPVADIQHIKGGLLVAMHKAGSVTMERPMKKEAKTKRVAGEDLPHDAFAYVGDPEKTETWKLPIKFSTDAKTKRHIQNALARFEQTKGIPDDKKPEVKAKIVAAAHAHGIEVDEDEAKSAGTTLVKSYIRAEVTRIKDGIHAKADAAGVKLKKDLFDLAQFAEVLQRLAWLRYGAICEREMEDDESDMPEVLGDHLQALGDTFLAMAEEEIKELQDAASKAGKVTNMKKDGEGAELPEVVHDVMIGHLADAAASHETMADAHKAMADEHTEKAADHKGFMDHFKKAEDDGGEHEEHHAVHAEIQKTHMEHHLAKAEHHMTMHKAHSEMAANCASAAEKCSAEKSVKALSDARAKKVAVKAFKKTPPTSATLELPADVTAAAKAAEAAVAAEWFASEEFKEIQRDKLRKAANADASVSLIPGVTANKTSLHRVDRDGSVAKAGSDDAAVDAALGMAVA